MRRGAIALFFALALPMMAGCGAGSSDDRTASAPGSVVDEFAARFDAKLSPLGFRIGRAGFTSDVSSDDYTADGQHLAVYVIPLRPLTDEQYVDGVAEVARVFLPTVFEDYPRLATFDVCEEPRVDQDEEPPPRTQIVLNREQAGRVDWASVSTAELVVGSRATPNTVNLFVDDALRRSSAWADVEHPPSATD